MNNFNTALGLRLRNNIYRNVYLVHDTLEQLLNVYIYMITGLLLLDFGIKFNALHSRIFKKNFFWDHTYLEIEILIEDGFNLNCFFFINYDSYLNQTLDQA